MVDAVVVGGGPAGSVSALLLARQGYSVTLLERQYFPRAKACGECLSPGANAILRRIGVWDDVLRARPALLHGWQLISPDGIRFSARFDEIAAEGNAAVALALPRAVLDAVLLDHARAAGVVIHHGASVNNIMATANGTVCGVEAKVGGELRRIRARFTIGADGLRSVVARKLSAYARRPRVWKTSFTLHTRLDAPVDFGEMRLAAGACLGLAPLNSDSGERMQNVTLVLNHGCYDPHGGVDSIVDHGLQRFGLRHAFPQRGRILTSGPFDWPVRRTAFDGAALIGDAAGYFDPFTGQGIFHALASAEILAEHAGAALRKRSVVRSNLREFARAQNRLTGPARRVQQIIDFVCSRPRLADGIFRQLSRRPELAHALIGVTGDLLPAGKLLSPRLIAQWAA